MKKSIKDVSKFIVKHSDIIKAVQIHMIQIHEVHKQITSLKKHTLSTSSLNKQDLSRNLDHKKYYILLFFTYFFF